jgi:hypothetical protein
MVESDDMITVEWLEDGRSVADSKPPAESSEWERAFRLPLRALADAGGYIGDPLKVRVVLVGGGWRCSHVWLGQQDTPRFVDQVNAVLERLQRGREAI